MNDYDYNDPAKNEGEWILYENIAFDYSLCLEDVSINVRSLHIHLPISKIACLHIQDNEGSVFIVPPCKRDQSPIVFGRGRAQAPIPKESDDDMEPPQFFHYAWSVHRMMKRMGYNLNREDGLDFGKGRRIPEGKPPNYYD